MLLRLWKMDSAHGILFVIVTLWGNLSTITMTMWTLQSSIFYFPYTFLKTLHLNLRSHSYSGFICNTKKWK